VGYRRAATAVVLLDRVGDRHREKYGAGRGESGDQRERRGGDPEDRERSKSQHA
jgi:hypothetical protein